MMEQGSVQGQLLPRERPRCRLQRVHNHVHGRLRDLPDLLLPAPKPQRDGVAVDPRRRHVLRLRHDRRRPLVGTDHIR